MSGKGRPPGATVSGTTMRETPADLSPGVAVIGMAGRFPGTKDIDELWENLREGRDAVRFLDEEELLRRGLDPALLEDAPRPGSFRDGRRGWLRRAVFRGWPTS